jgi:hypothetical protein
VENLREARFTGFLLSFHGVEMSISGVYALNAMQDIKTWNRAMWLAAIDLLTADWCHGSVGRKSVALLQERKFEAFFSY